MRPKKFAIATLVYGPSIYRVMAKILFDTARRHGFFAQAEPVLLTPEAIPESEFSKWGVRVVEIPQRNYPFRPQGPCPGTYQKFETYRLTDYQKVLFSDADAYVIDRDLFSFRLPAPVFLVEQHVPLATGNFLIEPNLAVYERLVGAAMNSSFDVSQGWENCGEAPPWPEWHRRKFHEQFVTTTHELIRNNSWNFVFAGAEQGLLYYYHSYCTSGYMSYHFPAFYHLSGVGRAARLLGNLRDPYWQAAEDAGVADELRQACLDCLD